VVHVVSPRVFEAAALGTAMILFPGDYSGVVRPGEHYIALQKDFSNMDDVVEQLRDDELVRDMTVRARDDIIRSGRWSYQAFIADFDRVVDEEARSMRGPSRTVRYHLAKVERGFRVPPATVRLARAAYKIGAKVAKRDPSLRFSVENTGQLRKGMTALRLASCGSSARQALA